jgi:RHS repeat-associated protein
VGTLSDTNSDGIPDTVASPTRTESWTTDTLGNFTAETLNGTATSRTVDKQNQTTAVGSASLAYDNNGNATTDDQGHTLVYDAWNRLVTVKSGSTTLATYKYDGLNRQVQALEGGVTLDLYFGQDGNVIERDVAGSAGVQYIWDPNGTNTLVARNRDVDHNLSNGLEERLYYQQDANANVTAFVNTSGSVVERYQYDPYGGVTYLNASWGTLSASAYAATYLFQGERFDPTVGLYHAGARDYSPTLDTWLEQDPAGYGASGMDLYQTEGDNPVNRTDPSGEFFSWIATAIGAGVGATVGAGVNLATQLYNGQGVDWRDVAAAGVGGAVNGAIVGAFAGALTGDFSAAALATSVLIGAGAGGAGGFAQSATSQLLHTGTVSFSTALQAGAVGAAGGAVGGAFSFAVGAAVSGSLAEAAGSLGQQLGRGGSGSLAFAFAGGGAAAIESSVAMGSSAAIGANTAAALYGGIDTFFASMYGAGKGGGAPKGKMLSTDAQQIAKGHAWAKHKGEFPEFSTEGEFAQHIDQIMSKPSASKDLAGGRKAFWDDNTKTVVIRDPNSPDLGTAFRPKNGKEYFDNLK